MSLRENWNTVEREWRKLLAAAGRSVPARPHGPSPENRCGRAIVLFAELEDLRRAWGETFEPRTCKNVSERFVHGQWTVKDLIAHMASWAEETRRDVEVVRGGHAFGYHIPYALSVVGPNSWNEAEVEKRRTLSIERIVSEGLDEVSRLQEVILNAPEKLLVASFEFPYAPTGDPSALWKGTIAEIVLLQVAHLRMHMARFRKWRLPHKQSG